jgi:hypothetical protein
MPLIPDLARSVISVEMDLPFMKASVPYLRRLQVQ